MKNTTDLVTLRINFFKQMNDFISAHGDDHDLAMWNFWIIKNTFESIATTIAQDDKLWSDMCAFFGDLTE
jgi:hypothetical protein